MQAPRQIQCLNLALALTLTLTLTLALNQGDSQAKAPFRGLQGTAGWLNLTESDTL